MGLLTRHDGADSGQCLVYHRRTNMSFIVSISDAELLAATHVAEARERAVRRTIERLEAAKETVVELILSIDPGPQQSAYLLYDPTATAYPLVALSSGIVANKTLREQLICDKALCVADILVIEEIASYGMPVGREVFETVFWSGRFVEAWGGTFALLPRREVKLHLCHSSRTTDATIRQALIDQFGGKERAIGRKACPGPLYGIRKDLWSALALAVTYVAHAGQDA